ncbi:hypothetical protein NG895_14995 [Aeoliella sp. ICT_H6.2]|uniref:HEAT repeat protein n=1 Tax=Aeoliella straminimaris TaxID=2954799 RepID=A0A9X2FBU2_9BACT|nr:hypothetical protein [Aeoliella straminimaris]MCO6045217.1 hypothetical protein [Aeoliella straminimaris]
MSKQRLSENQHAASRWRQRPRWYSGWVLALALCALGAGPVLAQDTPADDETPVVQEPKFPGDADYEPVAPSPTALADPAVRAVLNKPRTTAADHLRATNLLLQLGEGELAAGEFHRLLATNPDDATKVALVQQFGPAVVQSLARAGELGPAARPFVNSVFEAVAADAASDDRMQSLLGNLDSDNGVARGNAIAGLAGLGERAVVPLIQLLAGDEASDEERQGARAALVRLGPIATRPLLATLDSGNDRLVAEASELLAAIGAGEAAPLLAVPAMSGGSAGRAYKSLTGQEPSVESATGLLERTLDRLEGGAPVFMPGADDMVTYWVWHGKQNEPVPLALTVAEANTMYMAPLASQLAELRGGIPSVKTKSLRLKIESAAIRGRQGHEAGYTKEVLEDLPADWLDRLLRDAMEENQVAAATLALQVIAERRNPAVLITTDGLPSPTARALEHPHPTIRTAALETIAAIDPTKPFPGASKVCPAIVQLAAASGDQVVLAASPQIDAATTWAGGLGAMNLVGEVVGIGQEAVERAGENADIELILIDMSIAKPAVRETVFRLRRQPATGLVPIALLAREWQLHTARTIASEHDAVVASPRPHSDEVLTEVAESALAHLPSTWPTDEQRLTQADTAMQVASKLLDNKRDFYRLRAASDLLAQHVRPAAEGEANWKVLAKMGTHESQVALAAYANAPALSIESRRAAASAFADSVQQFGLRLTADEIVRQYDLYNASATSSKETQQVLGSLLDAIEAGRGSQPEE